MSTEKMHNLKAENYVLLGGLSEDSSPGGSLSDSSEGLLQKVRKEPGHMGVSATKTRWLEHQKITVKENQVSQVNEFSAFLCMGRCKSLGSLKLFL